MDHLTAALTSGRWLSARRRIDFKIRLLLCKALKGLGPKCIWDLLPRYEVSGRLGQLCFLSPESKLNVEKQRLDFMIHMWNKVPEKCSSAATLSSFKSRQKTFLFAAFY